MNGEPWQRLGIAPTSDVAEIRRAYAAILKTIDVDRDPDAFRALREAFDEAKNWAPYVDLIDADDTRLAPGVSDEWDSENADAVVAEPSSSDLAGAGDERDDEPAASPPFMTPEWDEDYPDPLPLAIRAAMDELTELLAGDAPVAMIEPELLDRMQQIFDDPAMFDVAHAATVENDLVWMIMAHMPRSKPMLSPAIAYFGWEAQARRWDCPHSIREIAALYDAAQYIATQCHRYNSSATAISLLDNHTPPLPRNIRMMRDFFNKVDEEYPEAWRLFSDNIVDQWREHIAEYDNRFPRKVYRDLRIAIGRLVVALGSSRVGRIFLTLAWIALVVLGIFILLAMILKGAGGIIFFGWAIIGLKNFIMRRWK